jgi:cell division protein FtsN
MPRAPQPLRKARSPRRSGAGGTLFGIFVGLVIGLGMAAAAAFWLMRHSPAVQASVTGAGAREAARDTGHDKAADKPRFDFYKILPGVEEPKVNAERKVERPDRALAEQSRNVARGATAGAAGGAVPPAAGSAAPGGGPAGIGSTAGNASADDARASAKPRAATPPSPAGGDGAASAPGSPPATRAAPGAPDRVASIEPPRPARAGERYWLQAGSFSAQSDAENLKARLALAGWEANVQEGNVPDKGVRYRVRLGPYDDPDELSRMKAELARRGFDVAVIKY